jgi:NAD(P)-dependent dehydrogenase (short-subunit alcohol dehydrogenase family)
MSHTAEAVQAKAAPQGRRSRPKDMTSPGIFLASHGSDFMTGQVLVVDADWRAQRL